MKKILIVSALVLIAPLIAANESASNPNNNSSTSSQPVQPSAPAWSLPIPTWHQQMSQNGQQSHVQTALRAGILTNGTKQAVSATAEKRSIPHEGTVATPLSSNSVQKDLFDTQQGGQAGLSSVTGKRSSSHENFDLTVPAPPVVPAILRSVAAIKNTQPGNSFQEDMHDTSNSSTAQVKRPRIASQSEKRVSTGLSPEILNQELLAVCEGSSQSDAESLIKLGASVKAKKIVDGKYMGQPLHLASGQGNLSLVNLLLEKNAPVDSRNAFGTTPLHIASCEGRELICKRLLETHADADAQDIHNRTALHFAAHGGHAPICRLLLSRGADMNLVDDEGKSSLALARESGNQQVIEVFVQNILDSDGLVVLGSAKPPILEEPKPVRTAPSVFTFNTAKSLWSPLRLHDSSTPGFPQTSTAQEFSQVLSSGLLRPSSITDVPTPVMREHVKVFLTNLDKGFTDAASTLLEQYEWTQNDLRLVLEHATRSKNHQLVEEIVNKLDASSAQEVSHVKEGTPPVLTPPMKPYLLDFIRKLDQGLSHEAHALLITAHAWTQAELELAQVHAKRTGSDWLIEEIDQLKQLRFPSSQKFVPIAKSGQAGSSGVPSTIPTPPMRQHVKDFMSKIDKGLSKEASALLKSNKWAHEELKTALTYAYRKNDHMLVGELLATGTLPLDEVTSTLDTLQ